MADESETPPTIVRLPASDDTRNPCVGAHVRFVDVPDDAALDACGRLWAAFVHARSEESSWELNESVAALSLLPDAEDGEAAEDLEAFLRHEIDGVLRIASASVFAGDPPPLDVALSPHPAFERAVAAYAPEPEPEPPSQGDRVESALALIGEGAERYGDRAESLREAIRLLGDPDVSMRIVALESLAEDLRLARDPKDLWSILALVAADDESERVRALAILLMGDEDDPEAKRGVPPKLFSSVLNVGLADPEKRVRETAALVLHEARSRWRRRQDDLPPLPWGSDTKKVRKWPLAMISGFWHGAEPPKRMPKWVLEEILRRLRKRSHPKADAGAHFLRRTGRPLPPEVVEALFERARREPPAPGALRLLVHCVGLDEDTRPLADAGLRHPDPYRRMDAFEAMTGALTPADRLALIGEHIDDAGLRRPLIRSLMIRIPAEAWDECRPVLEWLASHDDPEIAKAARHAIDETVKQSL